MRKNKVAIIMGSDSDYPIVKNAEEILCRMEIPYITRVMSAHRTPAEVSAFASQAKEEGFSVIIAAAGKAAHLAGVIASYTTLPVIGIPIKSSAFGGLDALLSTVQMPKGLPVATMAVDGAENAGLLAAEILGLNDSAIVEKLNAYRNSMRESVLEKNNQFSEE